MAVQASMDAVKVGQTVSATKTVSESDTYTFAGITGDLHPIHVNAEFAANTQFGKRLVHGALSLGFVAAAATRLAAQVGAPASVLNRYDLRFRRPVLFGDTLTATLTVTHKDPEAGEVVLEVVCTNQHGEAVTKGSVTMKLRSAPASEGEGDPS
jgi:3-hydroxybutyryl-CoA dehydratase